MMVERYKQESGQVIVILAIALVALLGFTAFAVDGGRIYSDRRQAQDGADASALAGAGTAAGILKQHSIEKLPGVDGENWDCASSGVGDARAQAVAQAILNASKNSFTITYSSDFFANGNIVATNCVEGSAHYIDIRVSVTMPSDTSFLHFVYQGSVQNTVDAITRVFPREPIAAGYSIVSLENDCSGNDKGTRFSGTSAVTLDDGGIFSNSCIISDGSSGSVTIDGGAASYDGRDFSFDPHGFPIISPAPSPVDYDYKPTFDFPGGCTGELNPSPSVSGSIYTYSPGRYTEGISITNSSETVFLKPGLYCFDDGADFKATGGNLSLKPGYANADGGIDGVTFYFTNDGGGFDTNGGAKVTLLAPIEPCTDNGICSPAVPNILIYMEEGNTNDITLGGNSESYYEGTVYAETAAVQVGGTASELSSVGVQVIADSVRVHGTVDMNITYDDSKVYHTTNKINLEK